MIKLNERPASLTNADRSGSCRYDIRVQSHNRDNVLDLLDWFWRRGSQAHIVCDVDMSAVEALRARLNECNQHVTVTSFVLKAISIAQERHPVSRTVKFPFGRSAVLDPIVAGFTVERSVDGEPVVFFGEIKDPTCKSLFEIADELKHHSDFPIEEVAELDKQKRFTHFGWLVRKIVFILGFCFLPIRQACNAATFGMSSLGSLGVEMIFGPSICTSIFGVGAVQQRPVVKDREIVIRPMMSISLNYDQSVMGAQQAAKFLNDVREMLEDPEGL